MAKHDIRDQKTGQFKMADDITTDASLGGRFVSKVQYSDSAWSTSGGMWTVTVDDSETGECATSVVYDESQVAAMEQTLAAQCLAQHKATLNAEPPTRRFNLPSTTEDSYETNDSTAEDTAEGE